MFFLVGCTPAVTPPSKTALILVDVQRDFMDDGPVPVKGALNLLPTINMLLERAGARESMDYAVATKDWHPQNHISFVTSHSGEALGSAAPQCTGEGAATSCINVTLFNSHCVAGHPGAEHPAGLLEQHVDWTVLKGTQPGVESYSGFYDLGHARSTGLTESLRARGVGTLVVAGVATEYCVLHTVLDALGDGFRVLLVLDGIAGITPGGSAAALDQMVAAGAVPVVVRPGGGLPGTPLLSTVLLELRRGSRHEAAAPDEL